MMLNEKTLEWLKRRKNLCTRCYKKDWCKTGAKHNFNTTKCRFWEFTAPGRITGMVFEDYRDAAEFEARVAEKLATVICGECEEFNKKPNCPHTIYQAPGLYECRMKHARLAVEREMIAEGKGPSGRMEKENGN